MATQKKAKNKRGRPLKLTKDRIIDELRKQRGLKYATADALRVSFQTLQNYIVRWPDLKDVIKEERGRLLDKSEKNLAFHIDQGNLDAIKFYLKTQGKHRGYIEEKKVKHGNDPKNPVVQVEQPQPPRLPAFDSLPYELRQAIIQEIRKRNPLPNGLKELPLIVEGTANGTQDPGT